MGGSRKLWTFSTLCEFFLYGSFLFVIGKIMGSSYGNIIGYSKLSYVMSLGRVQVLCQQVLGGGRLDQMRTLLILRSGGVGKLVLRA